MHLSNFFKFRITISVIFLLLVLTSILSYSYFTHEANIVSIKINPQEENIRFFWKGENGVVLKNIENLENNLLRSNLKLNFAMNGGMFDKTNAPIGLYIEDGRLFHAINKNVIKKGKGSIPNFYLQPNGVFYLRSNRIAYVVKTQDFVLDSSITYATQSGPMLLVEGKINPIFKKYSVNYNIRNGVGVLPNHELIFAISKNKVNFYEFAKYFQDKGCINALYLDGYVSRAFAPELDLNQKDGDLGVLIGVFK
jgi:uncharacterized protein YigE (DUF2233 family)